MRNKKINTLIIGLLSIILFSNEFTYAAKAYDNTFDFSRCNSLETKVLDANDILSLIIPEQISEEEKNYLNTTNYKLMYEDMIPSSIVTTDISDNKLRIIADSYSYTDINNNTIIWIPDSVNYQEIKYNFSYSSNHYNLEFDLVDDNIESIDIQYKTTLLLDKDKVNSLINSAYNEADYYVKNDILNKNENQYQAEYQQYLKSINDYNNYVTALNKYNDDIISYNEYLSIKKDYDNKKTKYDAYLVDLNNYNQEYIAYEQSIKDLENYNIAKENYEKYLDAMEIYNQDLEKYNTEYKDYAPKIEKVNYQLDAMELIVTKMTDMERNVYDAVMGDTVTSVLNRRDDLVVLQADPEVIDLAQNSTIALREIFEDYFSRETREEKYQAYCSYYTSVKKHIENLCRALDKLYRSGRVPEAINYYSKEPQYLLLVAQLVLISNALDTSQVKNYELYKGSSSNQNAKYFDDKWTIKGQTMLQILGQSYWTDNNTSNYTSPYKSGYPVEPVAPIEPTKYDNPGVAPSLKNEPIPPIEVENPGDAPTIINEPIKPVEVIYPTEPERIETNKIILDIIDSYNRNDLVKRDEYNDNIEVLLTTTINKSIHSTDEINVIFYTENNEFINNYTVDYNSALIYEDEIPTKDGDEKYESYSFSHWEYDDGEILNLRNVTREGYVYPVYTPGDLRKYTITFIIYNNEEITKEYYYGEIPECAVKSPIVNDNTYLLFENWDKSFVNVTVNETYYAEYSTHNIIDNSTITIIENNIFISNSSNNNAIDLSNVFSMLIDNNTNEIIVNNDTYEIVIPSLTIDELKDNNCYNISINIINNGNYSFDFSINIDSNITNNILFKLNEEFDEAHSSLYLIENGNETKIRSNFTSNSIQANIDFNKNYRIYPTYSIYITNYDEITLTTNSIKAKGNEKIDVEIATVANGYEVSSIIVSDVNGNQIEITDNSFLMPYCDTYVRANIKQLSYLISFVVDGEIISETYYHYGDEVIVPIAPHKLSDENYSYTFIGWDNEINNVSEDKTYTAIFEENEIEKPFNNNKIGVLRKAIIIACVAFVSLIALIIILIVFKRRKKLKHK